MPLLQTYELPLMRARDPTKLGNGIFLNPYSGGGYEHPVYGKHNHNFGIQYHGDRIKGDGMMDFLKSGVEFFSKHGSTIANAANVASGIANVVKTVKDIDTEDKKLYDLKRVNLALEAKLLGNKATTKKVT